MRFGTWGGGASYGNGNVLSHYPGAAMSSTPNRPQRSRRDFLTGAAAGAAVVGGAAEAVTAFTPYSLFARPFPPDARPFYAQSAEDVVLRALLTRRGVTTPTYLDVGAWEPVVGNNTYLLYEGGASGVLVEPNVDLTAKLRRSRPRDTVLPVGIGFTGDAEADFYRLSDSQLSTFDKEQADRVVATGEVSLLGVVKTPLLTLNQVIEKHLGGAAPDLLSVDVEGLEFPIVKTLDLAKYRPRVVCVDALVTGTLTQRADTTEHLLKHGYEVRGMTFPNVIFVDKAWFYG